MTRRVRCGIRAIFGIHTQFGRLYSVIFFHPIVVFLTRTYSTAIFEMRFENLGHGL